MKLDDVLNGDTARLGWRVHLIQRAMDEDAAMDGEGDPAMWRAGFLMGATRTITAATLVEGEDYAEVVNDIYDRLKAERGDREEGERRAERAAWVRDVADGKTERGYREWKENR